jgi:hypothetical protein
MMKRPKIKINRVPAHMFPAPVTEADFVHEMASEAVVDLIIQGYHMAPDGTEYFAEGDRRREKKGRP